jgi:hypothetical protein
MWRPQRRASVRRGRAEQTANSQQALAELEAAYFAELAHYQAALALVFVVEQEALEVAECHS